ncbi:pyrin isoform X1 [Pipistrellus kuhlii]|uniref:pyrin isoform X1 n=1 Tax=Pipistrellus kuhlii TaxID=59472 RepID=UPI001E27081E|nr:pyrin isoform X1 [Pipistrellus kuhlii]
MAGTRDAILDALEELTADELKKFKLKLQNAPMRDGYSRIPRGALQRMDAVDLADRLVSCYLEAYAAELTAQLLRDMGMQEAAEQLQAPARAPGWGAGGKRLQGPSISIRISHFMPPRIMPPNPHLKEQDCEWKTSRPARGIGAEKQDGDLGFPPPPFSAASRQRYQILHGITAPAPPKHTSPAGRQRARVGAPPPPRAPTYRLRPCRRTRTQPTRRKAPHRTAPTPRGLSARRRVAVYVCLPPTYRGGRYQVRKARGRCGRTLNTPESIEGRAGRGEAYKLRT